MLKIEVKGTDVTVYRKDWDTRATYSVQLGKKVDDKWDNTFIPIQFKRGVELANKTKIDINSAWLTFYRSKDQKKDTLYIFCNDFTANEIPKEVPSGFDEIDDSSIPF